MTRAHWHRVRRRAVLRLGAAFTSSVSHPFPTTGLAFEVGRRHRLHMPARPVRWPIDMTAPIHPNRRTVHRDDRAMLDGWLDWHRGTPMDQMRRPHR